MQRRRHLGIVHAGQHLGHSSYGDLADVKVEARSGEALPYMADLIISRPQGRQTPVL